MSNLLATRSKATPSEQSALVARVLASRHFQRSPRLRELLAYISERYSQDASTTISEAEIAEHVFGRSAPAPGGDDTIVRVHASNLRKRLAHYFRTEGSDEELIFELPKGSYVPVFQWREVEPAEEEEPARAPWYRRLSVNVTALVGVVAIAVCLTWWASTIWNRHVPASPCVRAFWSVFLDSKLPLDVVLADSSLSVLQDIGHLDMTVGQYSSQQFWTLIESIPDHSTREAVMRVASHRYTNIAVANVSRKIATLEGMNTERLRVLWARNFQPGMLKTDDVILLGSKRSNPWVELVESQLSFQIAYIPSKGIAQIRNVKPRAGEQSLYTIEDGPQMPRGYCVVARVPGLNAKGKTLVLEGTDSEGTEACGDFVLNETSLRQLCRALGIRPGDTFPDFEALLQTSRVGGVSPQAQLILTRLH